MSESNARKGAKNVFFGILSQIITIALGIIIPRLFLLNYGSEMNGLINSVSQLYVYMTLLEGGVGAATTQALYGALGRSSRNEVNSIISATSYYYKRIGVIYFIGVIIISIGYPFVVKSTIPFWTTAGIIFLNGISGVLSFYFQAKFLQLLQADGRNYFITNTNLIIHILVSISKIVLIYLNSNILFIQTVFMLLNLTKMLFIILYVKKTYPWLDLSVKPNVNAIAQKGSALIHQLSDLVFRNTDVLVLTFAPNCGLLFVSVYTMYSMLYGMIGTAVETIGSGVQFFLGQTFNRDKTRYIILHDIYETYFMALIFALYTIAYIFMIPFLKLYTAGIKDVNYIDKWLPLLFVITFLLSAGRRASAMVINFAQHFKLTQNRALVEAGINLLSSIIFVGLFGIYGVLLGTIIGLLYRTNDMILYSNHIVLNRSARNTYKRWIVNFLVFSFFAMCSKLIFKYLVFDSYLCIIIYATIACFTVIPIYILIASITNADIAKEAKIVLYPHIKRIVSNKLRKNNSLRGL